MVKKLKWYHISLITVCLIFFILMLVDVYHLHISEYGKAGKRNMNNAEKVHVGMYPNDVIGIMGLPPDSVSQNAIVRKEPIRVLEYPSNNSDFLEIQIRFDSADRVSKVIIPYNWSSNISYQ